MPRVTAPSSTPSELPNTGTGVTPLTNSAGQVVAYQAIDPTAQYIVAGVGCAV